MSAARFFPVAGFCPSCRTQTLFLALGGFVTCARLDCQRPEAANEVLHDRIAMNIALELMDEAERRSAS